MEVKGKKKRKEPKEKKKIFFPFFFISSSSSKAKTKKMDEIEIRVETFRQKLQKYRCKYSEEMINDFFEYWTEPDQAGEFMRFEYQPFFAIGRRLGTWKRNRELFNEMDKPKLQIQENGTTKQYARRANAKDRLATRDAERLQYERQTAALIAEVRGKPLKGWGTDEKALPRLGKLDDEVQP